MHIFTNWEIFRYIMLVFFIAFYTIMAYSLKIESAEINTADDMPSESQGGPDKKAMEQSLKNNKKGIHKAMTVACTVMAVDLVFFDSFWCVVLASICVAGAAAHWYFSSRCH